MRLARRLMIRDICPNQSAIALRLARLLDFHLILHNYILSCNDNSTPFSLFKPAVFIIMTRG